MLTKKTETLQNEIERLKEKQAQQRKLEKTNKTSTLPPPNSVPHTDDASVPPSRPVSSCSSSPSRGSFFSSVISPLPSRPINSQYHPSLNSVGYLPSPARAVGSPSSKMFPRSSQSNNQPSPMRPSPFSSAESGGPQGSRASYAAASAGNSVDAFGQSYSYRDSTPGKQLKDGDSEVHSLLSPNDSPPVHRSDFPPQNATGNGSRLVYDGTGSKILSGLRCPKTENAESPVSTSLPSFASLFSKDEGPVQPAVPYSPWGNSNFDFSSSTAPLLFNIKPSSLTVTPPGFSMDPQSRFPDSTPRSPSETSHKVLDQNAVKRNQGFNDLFRF